MGWSGTLRVARQASEERHLISFSLILLKLELHRALVKARAFFRTLGRK
jgi:hypothetical protein